MLRGYITGVNESYPHGTSIQLRVLIQKRKPEDSIKRRDWHTGWATINYEDDTNQPERWVFIDEVEELKTMHFRGIGLLMSTYHSGDDPEDVSDPDMRKQDQTFDLLHIGWITINYSEKGPAIDDKQELSNIPICEEGKHHDDFRAFRAFGAGIAQLTDAMIPKEIDEN